MAQYAKIAFDYTAQGKWAKNGISDISVRKEDTGTFILSQRR
jgi:hypothetical protein